MKYKDPITGELRDVIIKSGDTLPIGTVVEFDGDTIPDGYEEFETEDYGSLGNIIVDDVICKNIANIHDITTGITLRDDGTTNSNENYFVTNYIEIEPNTGYTESMINNYTDSESTVRCCAYDKNKNFIKLLASFTRTEAKQYIKTFTTPANAKYVRMGLRKTDTNIQLEKGSVATDYVEYKEFSNKQIYSTNEQVIGIWLGKPLYRKVIDFGALPNTTSKSVAHDISNIDYIVDICATAALPGGDTMKLDVSDKDGLKFSVHISANNTNITVLTGSDRSGFTRCYVTLEYTKTTD